ncbi:MAG: acetyl-CoA carboxylase biotin carboxyl carrier protein [Pseudonocardiaceae bacterium]
MNQSMQIGVVKGLDTALGQRWEQALGDGEHAELFVLLNEVRRTATELLAHAAGSPSALNVRAGDVSVELSWHSCVVEQPAAEPRASAESPESAVDAMNTLSAPTVGVFYRSPSPGAEPFVRKGDTVIPGQQVGIVEAMKLMIPVEADRHGLIAEVLKQDGDSVEFAEPLFALVPVEKS